MDNIEVCMPTWNSEDVISESLNSLRESELVSEITIQKLIIIDNYSSDNTVDIIEQCADEFGWDVLVIQSKSNLAQARQEAINNVTSKWFLFLDDDVLISKDFLTTIESSISPLVGGVQGIKESNTLGDPHNWVRWRAHRGGTHSTVIRHQAVKDIEIPNELDVLEDEYIRQHVEKNDWLWLFNHQVPFEHNDMGRHPATFHQGFLGGKYGLMTCYLTIRALLASIQRKEFTEACEFFNQLVGWTVGKISSKLSRRLND
ncbi:glycosyltransferase family 2 protein [Halorubrum ruber]|uniref:Glycosyltransferase family 2 protein n=1 Tax=Halorubrum ruber TaxID=2982524 RepID=A0A8T8LLR6_9EURY|nr:glycosyltransferase family 2 protein [Halorubrum ruber]QUO47724.1 glycosyltransferase family 2 protein [Halorubrum ruber]